MTTESQNSEGLIDQLEDDTENALQGNKIDQEKPEHNTNGLVLEQKPEGSSISKYFQLSYYVLLVSKNVFIIPQLLQPEGSMRSISKYV